MAKRPRRTRRVTDDQHILGVERIDADPEDIARAVLGTDSGRAKAAAKARRKQVINKQETHDVE